MQRHRQSTLCPLRERSTQPKQSDTSGAPPLSTADDNDIPLHHARRKAKKLKKNYKLGKQLGEGAFAIVFSAEKLASAPDAPSDVPKEVS